MQSCRRKFTRLSSAGFWGCFSMFQGGAPQPTAHQKIVGNYAGRRSSRCRFPGAVLENVAFPVSSQAGGSRKLPVIPFPRELDVRAELPLVPKTDSTNRRESELVRTMC
jgi:hypothetical protein